MNRVETPTPRPEVRAAVRALLTQAPAYAQLSADKRQQVARGTALIADYLAAPEGIPAERLQSPARALIDDPGPQEASYEEASKNVRDIGKSKFEGSAAREGANVAGLLMKQVNFPTFVAGLIQGVFQAIVKSSIEQM